MFQIDDKFLEDMGLGSMPREQKDQFLSYIREQLQLRVGMKMSEGLTDDQLRELNSLIDHDRDTVETWVQNNAPNYQDDVIYTRLKQTSPDTVSDFDVLAEFASMKWLSINRPDNRKIVIETMQELRAEIFANRDAILSE